MATTDFIAAIELSSSKISGIAGKKSSDGSIQVLAYAREDASPFIHKGAIYNIDKAAQALTSIINKLEGQLNNSIAKVYVGIGGQSLRTVRNAVSRTLEEESIISQELVDEICDENRDVPLVDMSGCLASSRSKVLVRTRSRSFPMGLMPFFSSRVATSFFVMKPAYTVSFITSSTSWHTCEVGLRLKAVTATTR